MPHAGRPSGNTPLTVHIGGARLHRPLHVPDLKPGPQEAVPSQGRCSRCLWFIPEAEARPRSEFERSDRHLGFVATPTARVNTRRLTVIEAHAADEFANLLDEADEHESGDGQEDGRERERSCVEPDLHRAEVDRDNAQHHLADEHVVQRCVGETVGNATASEHALHFRRRGDCCSNLSKHKRPIVDAHALGVGELVLLGVIVGALARPVKAEDTGSCIEEGSPTTQHLELADVAIAVEQDLAIHKFFLYRVARATLHELRLRGLQSIGDGSPNVSADVDQEHLCNRQGLREAEELTEGRCHLRDLGAERVHDGLLQVFAGEAALLDAIDDGCKVVVLQNDVCSILGNLSATDTHGNTNLGLLQGRRVIHAVTSHGTDVTDASIAVFLVGLHDDLLVDRGDAREDPGVRHGLLPPRDVLGRLVVREIVRLGHAGVELHARDDGELCGVPAARDVPRQDVDALGDGPGGVGVVAGHHHNLHAGVGGLNDGVVDSLLGGILDAVEAHELEVLEGEVAILRARALKLGRGRGDLPAGDGQHAAGIVHQHLHLLLNGIRRGLVQRAVVHDAVGGALEDGEDLAAAHLAVHGEHPLVLGVEGDLEQRLVLRLLLELLGGVRAALDLARGAHDGNLGRGAGPLLFAFLVTLQLRTVVQDAADGDVVARRLACSRPNGAPLAHHNRKAVLGDGGGRRLHDDQVLDGHLTLCECPRLVRAEDSDATQGFDRIDLAHQDLALDHLRGGEHERNGDGGQETFRHLGEQCTRGVLDHIRERRLLHNLHAHAQQADEDCDNRDEVDEMLDLDLERGLHVRGLDGLGDFPQEGAVPRRVHHARGVALEHGGPEEGQVAGLGRWLRRFLRAGVPGFRHGLACERRVVDLHAIGAVQDTHVRRNTISGLQEDDVARHEVDGVHLDVQAVAGAVSAHHRHGFGARHFLHGLHGVLSQHLRVPLQHGRGYDDDRKQDGRHHVLAAGLLKVLLGAVVARRTRVRAGLCLDLLLGIVEGEEKGDHGDHARPQQEVENAAKGHSEKFDPLVLLLGRSDRIRAVDLAVDACLVLLEAGLADLANAIVRKLSLEDGGEPGRLDGVHQGLVILLVVERIMGRELAVPLPDMLGLCDDGAARAENTLGAVEVRHGFCRLP
mmetsp:Transcript_118028/g.376306  ORF Transcript_118028/g.376306 Transcript_118028/m.376306 type:complete len:1136 (+) Transcript_118028:229-3636(+)